MQKASDQSIVNVTNEVSFSNTNEDLEVDCKRPHEEVEQEYLSLFASLKLSIDVNCILMLVPHVYFLLKPLYDFQVFGHLLDKVCG